ncbi:MAG: cell division ATP-binding protein FtsE [Bdellovibrionota bacterium]
MIEFSHVYKTYPGPVHALRNVDLKINQGEFVFLTGPSGAGKSTLFKMMSAFDVCTSGQIAVAGYNLNDMKAKELPYFRRQIGMVFQDFKLLPEKTVAENVGLSLWVRNEKSSLIEKKVSEVLDQVNLSHRADHYPEMLSGGEQQRVAIARAIIHQPSLLIADEPTGNLDPKMSEEIMDLLEHVCLQGTTIFVATHDHSMVERRKKKTLEIRDGILSGDLK